MENLICIETLLYQEILWQIYRFKRRLRFCPGSRVFPKVPLLHLEGNNYMLPVQSSSIRPLFGPQNFYERFKTCCCIPEEEGHWSPYIPGGLSSFGCNSGEAVKNIQLVVTLLQSLGLTINLKKSLLIPTQVITFHGFQIDSMCMMISLPAEKANKILDCCAVCSFLKVSHCET